MKLEHKCSICGGQDYKRPEKLGHYKCSYCGKEYIERITPESEKKNWLGLMIDLSIAFFSFFREQAAEKIIDKVTPRQMVLLLVITGIGVRVLIRLQNMNISMLKKIAVGTVIFSIFAFFLIYTFLPIIWEIMFHSETEEMVILCRLFMR